MKSMNDIDGDIKSRRMIPCLREGHRVRAIATLSAVGLAVYAFILGTSTRMEPHAVWAMFAFVGYCGCAGMLLRRRWSIGAIAAVSAGFCAVLPGVALIVRGLSQHEVGIVRDGAIRALASASPYVTDPAVVDDVFPYFPLMSVFGIPGAAFGENPLGDPRISFTLFFAVVTWVSLRRLVDTKIAVRAEMLMIACPLVAIPIATGGVDLPVAALAGLAVITLWTGEYRLNAIVVGVGCAIKFTFWPLAAMMIVVQVRRGRRAEIRRWAAVVAAIVGAAVLPAVLVDPRGFARSAIEFPLGLSAIESPAGASALGGALAEKGFLGYAGIVTSLLASAVAITWIALAKRHLGLTDILLLAAAGYTILFLVSPVSRAGYFVLPFVLGVLGVVAQVAGSRAAEVVHPDGASLAEKGTRS